jgi:hypothetical protein
MPEGMPLDELALRVLIAAETTTSSGSIGIRGPAGVGLRREGEGPSSASSPAPTFPYVGERKGYEGDLRG